MPRPGMLPPASRRLRLDTLPLQLPPSQPAPPTAAAAHTTCRRSGVRALWECIHMSRSTVTTALNAAQRPHKKSGAVKFLAPPQRPGAHVERHCERSHESRRCSATDSTRQRLASVAPPATAAAVRPQHGRALNRSTLCEAPRGAALDVGLTFSCGAAHPASRSTMPAGNGSGGATHPHRRREGGQNGQGKAA